MSFKYIGGFLFDDKVSVRHEFNTLLGYVDLTAQRGIFNPTIEDLDFWAASSNFITLRSTIDSKVFYTISERASADEIFNEAKLAAADSIMLAAIKSTLNVVGPSKPPVLDLVDSDESQAQRLTMIRDKWSDEYRVESVDTLRGFMRVVNNLWGENLVLVFNNPVYLDISPTKSGSIHKPAKLLVCLNFEASYKEKVIAKKACSAFFITEVIMV